MKSIKPVYCIVIVFLLGVLGGALATHLYYKCRMDFHMDHHGRGREEHVVNHLNRELGLSPVQKEQVRGIVHETEEEIRGVRSQFRPRMEAVLEKAQLKVSALLTPEQRKKFEKMIAERKERFKKRDD